MRLSVDQDTILSELKTSKAILDKWIENIGAGVPVLDIPTSSPEQLEDFVRALCGELLIVTGKCESLSNVLSGTT